MITKQVYVEELANATQTRAKLIATLAELKATGQEQYVIAAFNSSLYIIKGADGRYWARFLTTDGLLVYKDRALAGLRCNYFRQVFKDAVVVPYAEALQKQIDSIDTLLGLLNTAIAKAAS